MSDPIFHKFVTITWHLGKCFSYSVVLKLYFHLHYVFDVAALWLC
jgi:hypothetical protein